MSLLIDRTDRILKVAASVKESGDAELSYAMTGRLYASQSGWLLLTVPNALVRGVFDTIQEPGAELPPGKNGNPFNAHISVMRPEELETIGGIDRVTERGHMFRYTLGPLKTVTPDGWKEMSKVWFVTVNSPELKKLRTSYGLSPLPNENAFDFHITCGVRRKSVLQHNDVAKAAEALPPESECVKGHGTIMGKCGHVIRTCRCCEASKAYQSEAYCDGCQEKLASLIGPITQQAWKQTPLRYNTDQNVLQNVLGHFNRVQQRGQTIVHDAQSLERWRNATDPQYGLESLARTLQGHVDPHVQPGFADQLLLNLVDDQ